jgi:hypothetical protein
MRKSWVNLWYSQLSVMLVSVSMATALETGKRFKTTKKWQDKFVHSLELLNTKVI